MSKVTATDGLYLLIPFEKNIIKEDELGTKDTVSNDYMKDNGHFADAFNYFIYGGEQAVKEKGEFIKLIKQICNKMSKNKGIEEIAEALDEDTSNVQKIYDVAIKYAPDYDVNKIYDELSGKM